MMKYIAYVLDGILRIAAGLCIHMKILLNVLNVVNLEMLSILRVWVMNNMSYSNEQIWNACVEIMSTDSKPLEIWKIANAAEMSEMQVITALIHCAVAPRYVQFRFPPLPRAAITKIVGQQF